MLRTEGIVTPRVHYYLIHAPSRNFRKSKVCNSTLISKPTSASFVNFEKPEEKQER